jgi:hypothetical protein
LAPALVGRRFRRCSKSTNASREIFERPTATSWAAATLCRQASRLCRHTCRRDRKRDQANPTRLSGRSADTNEPMRRTEMKKATTMGMAAVLAVASSMAMAAQGNVTNPYVVQPDEVRALNKAPSADDIMKICEHKAKHRNLSGAERDSFLSSCNQDL